MEKSSPQTYPRLDTILLWLNLALGLVLLLLIDRVMISVVRRLLWFPNGLPVALVWQRLGEGFAAAAFSLLILCFDRQRRHRALLFGLFLIITALPMYALKYTTGRVRPYVNAGHSAFYGPAEGLKDVDYQSFPSGHTVTAFTVAGVLGTWYPALRLPAILLASGVGVSRVYTMWHYPSDVYFGALLGLCLSKWLARSKRLEEWVLRVWGKIGSACRSKRGK